MPAKKTNLSEIKKGVIYEIEGMSAIEIAKALTADNFTILYEKEIISLQTTLASLKYLNKNRNERYKKSDLIAAMKTCAPLTRNQIPHVENAFVTVDRIRQAMRSETWKTYKEAFKEQHLKLIAEQEAKRYVEENK